MSNLKSGKIYFFAWFWSKICSFFILLFFRSNTPEKVFHDVLGRKLAILDNKNIEFKKWQNFHFC